MVATRNILSEHSLASAFALSLVYLVARLVQASVEVVDVTRKAQINRGVQTYLFRVVNRKIAALDPSLRSIFEPYFFVIAQIVSQTACQDLKAGSEKCTAFLKYFTSPTISKLDLAVDHRFAQQRNTKVPQVLAGKLRV